MHAHPSAVTAYRAILSHLGEVSPWLKDQIIAELEDQRRSLKLIASENYSSLSVQLAMGNLLTDKYSEGFPFHRFYAGCEHVDQIEQHTVDLAKQLFHADHAYVQPHSGADANLVAFLAVLYQRISQQQLKRLEKKQLDQLSVAEFEQLRHDLGNQVMMGLSLRSGGHLTHGYRNNISALLFRSVSYDVDPQSHQLDYGLLAQQVQEVRPLILLAGFSAYSRRINFAKMREIADSVGAVLMVDMAHFAGLVAGQVFQGEENPIPYADLVTTTTHKTLRGPRGGLVLCKEAWKDSVNRGCPLVLGGPLPHIIGAKGIAFEEALSPLFSSYSRQIVDNARALSAGLIEEGLSVITGGTDNHLLIVDLSASAINGRQAEGALREVGITVNRNMIPFDPKGPLYTSGIRLGTPALTTRGLGTTEMRKIAHWIAKVIKNLRPVTVGEGGKGLSSQYALDSVLATQIRGEVGELLTHFPLYPELTR